MFCEGMSSFRSVRKHYFGFLRYEEMMEDSVGNLKKLAEFIGCAFSQEEEKQGIIEGIVSLCSF